MASVQLQNATRQAISVGERVIPPGAVFEVDAKEKKSRDVSFRVDCGDFVEFRLDVAKPATAVRMD